MDTVGRKLLSVLLGAVCALTVCGCTPAEPQDGLAPKGELMQYTTFDVATWLRPLWHTREMYNETVLFVGEEDAAPLLYTPDKVLSVRSYGLQTEYEEGKDYALTADGKIKRLPGSAIPYFTMDEYYRTEPDSVPVSIFGEYAAAFHETRYIKYGETDTFTSRQIAVTYTHNDAWTGSVPADKSDRARSFTDKLRRKEKVTAVFYGDSITVGCNASGTEYGGNIAPFTPSYPQLVTDWLHTKFDAEIELVNTAVGGMNTEWGVDNLSARVLSHRPDLAVLAFGMNDPKLTVAKYRRMVADMTDAIHAEFPDCVVIAVSTSVPNNETDWYYGMQKEYGKGLRALEETDGYGFFAVADMTTMHLDLLQRKRFRDMTGNNINHPNDFLVRAYAQVILRTLLGDEFGVG